MVPVRCGCRKMDDNTGVNAAILERLEKVVQSLQENSVKMGELLAVHNEKLDKQDRIDAVLFEKIEQLFLISLISLHLRYYYHPQLSIFTSNLFIIHPHFT